MNLLEVLGIADNEDAVTNLLRHCVRHSAPFREVFLSSICGIPEPTDGWEARARMHIPGVGTPDLVLYRKGSPSELIILENKLHAGEGKGQTQSYADRACTDTLARDLELGPDVMPHFRYLTLFPEPARADSFTSCTYETLLRDPPPVGADDPLADQLVTALYDVLAGFYAHADLDPGDLLLERLSGETDSALDGGYLAFLAFLERIDMPAGVEVLAPFRQSWKGRKTYGAVISKESWRSSVIDSSGERWTLEPANRHIHLEPQFNALSSTFNLYIHYETHPYHSVRRLKSRVPSDQYDVYVQRREEFKKRFAQHTPPRFRVSGRTNQIARAILSLEGRTVAEGAELLTAAMNEATDWIDRTLRDEQS